MKLKGFTVSKSNAGITLDNGKILLILRWAILFSVFLGWWFTSNNAAGIALILALSSTTLIRMQFTSSVWILIIEELGCFICILYWPGAIFTMLLPAFESGVLGCFFTLAPVLLIIFLRSQGTNFGFILMLSLMSFSIGYILKAWSERENLYLKAADGERKQRYEVEQLKNELLIANMEVAKLVEATERNRIAQQLHDNVGHEIAGALIALQTYIKLEEANDKRAEGMLENVLRRVESSSVKLRETVYQLRPGTEGGALRLQKLCEEFAFCPVKCRFVGDKDRVPAVAWVILEPCLKEALTNISKYSKATEAEVNFDITRYILRMHIKDNGVGTKDSSSGMGLFGIRERIRAAGGTVSVDGSNGFMITCILPIDNY